MRQSFGFSLHNQFTHVLVVVQLAEEEVRREMASEAGGELHIPKGKKFDSNIITPVCCKLSHVDP